MTLSSTAASCEVRYILLLIGMALVSLAIPAVAQESNAPTGGNPWDLHNLSQPGLFVFYDTPAGASTTGKPLDIGDLDSNGCGDIVITGQNADFGRQEGWRRRAGHVRIVMNLCQIGGRIALEDEVSPDHVVLTIYGARVGDMAGTESYVADFNGDGYDDLLFSAQNNDGPNNGLSNAGAVYLVLGRPDFARRADIDLLQPPDNVLIFYGAMVDDRFGIWVEGGDFDGDGFDDLLIGANQADGENDRRLNAGEVWILYGDMDMVGKYGPVTDMSQPPADATLIIGADYDDLLGSCVWGDDVNDDGYDDAIVGAGLWRGSAGVEGLSFGGGDGPDNRRYNSGEVYVVFGNAGLRGQTIDLAARLDEAGRPVDDSITVIYGADPNDVLGEEIATGDLDGDGRNDLVLGTLVGDGPDNRSEDAGEAWVISTDDPFAGQMFDLASPQPGRAVVIYPDQPNSKGGDTIRLADLDGDGIDDLFYGAPDYDPIGYDLRARRNAGMLAVIFGEQGELPNTDGRIILPSQQPEALRVRYVVGVDDHDMMAYSMAVYDVDGDGIVDIAPNGMGGDGAYNSRPNAGEIYVISGAEFLSPSHNYQGTAVVVEATPVAIPTMTPPVLPPLDLSQPGNPERGRVYYQEACAGCHGPEGRGEGVGVSLVESSFVTDATDLELLFFLQLGRSADDPNNTTGVAMPAFGGRTDWGSRELWDVIAYLRQLVNRR